MAYQSKYTGLQIDDILDSVEWKEGKIEDLEQIRAGAQKGATALQSYTEKYTGTITGIKINGETKSGSGVIDLGTISTDISGKVDKVAGKQLSTEDFTTALKTKLEGLNNYDDTELSEALSTLRGDFDEIVSGDTTTAIKTFNEVIAFLDGLTDTQDLESIIASIEQQIAGKMDKVILATVATSGSYNDLTNKPTIPVAVTESTVSGWGFTKNTGTYSKPSGGIPKTDLASAVQTSLGKADTALQSHQDISGKQDKLVDGVNIATINGQSLTAGGDLTIEGGAKIYTWNWDGESESVTLSQEEYDNIVEADLVIVNAGGVYSFVVSKTGKEWSELLGYFGLVGQVDIQGNIMLINISINISTKLAKINAVQREIPTKTSQLENDSNFISSDNLKTINGESIVGSGDITISGGSSGGGDDIRYFTDFTVEQVKICAASYTTISYDATGLIDAARNNKLICVPYADVEKGYVIASYKFIDGEEHSIRLDATIFDHGANYGMYVGYSGSEYVVRGDGINAFSTQYQDVEVVNGEAYVYMQDNTLYLMTDVVEMLYVYCDTDPIFGSTIRFMSGENTTIEYWGNWANGAIPTIEPYTDYEMSIAMGADYMPCAVLTSFKYVE